MNRQEFDALLTRRDELQRKHDRACGILEEEPHPINHQRCVRLYDEIEKLQAQIDDELAAEQGREG